MTKTIRFTLLMTEKDRKALEALSKKMQRSKSDVIRVLISKAKEEPNAKT